MPSAQASSPVACIGGPLSAIDTDLLIVPWFQDEAAPAVPGVDTASGGEVARALASKEFQDKPFDLFLTPVDDKSWKARRVARIGRGSDARGQSPLR